MKTKKASKQKGLTRKEAIIQIAEANIQLFESDYDVVEWVADLLHNGVAAMKDVPLQELLEEFGEYVLVEDESAIIEGFKVSKNEDGDLAIKEVK